MKHLRQSNYKSLSHVIPNCFCFFLSGIAYANPYLLNWSTIVRGKNRHDYELFFYLVSTVSAWYLSNHEFDLIYITILFLFLILLNIWHDSLPLQKRSHSSYSFGQNTFSLFEKYSSISLVLRCDFVDLCAQSRK